MEPLLPTDVYKLIVTTDANKRISTCNGEISEAPAQSLRVYPNPVSRGEIFTLTLSAEDAGQDVFIYNASGTLINTYYAGNYTSQLKIDAPAGFYIIKAGKQSTTMVVKLFIIH
jgi:hypothetical protein